MLHKDSEKNNIVIVGAGPAGLTAALDILRKDKTKKVTVIESRPKTIEDLEQKDLTSIRTQLVKLDAANTKYLWSLLPASLTKEDKVFKTQLMDPKEHIAIKDIQRFLKRRLAKEKNFTFIDNATVSDIDMKNGEVKIDTKGSDAKILPYDCLIDAGGAKHETTSNLIEKGLDVEYKKTFESKMQYHASGYFIAKRKDGKPMPLPDVTLNTSTFVFKNKDYQLYIYTNRHSHIKSQGQQLKFYVTAELPYELYIELQKNPAEISRQLSPLAQRLYSAKDYEVTAVAKSQKSGLIKDNIKFLTFERNFWKATKAGVEKDGKFYLSIGDAFLTPDFYQGIGANNGMGQGIDAGELVTNRKSLAEFNEKSEQRASLQLKGTTINEISMPLEAKLNKPISANSLNEILLDILKLIDNQRTSMQSLETDINKKSDDYKKLVSGLKYIENYEDYITNAKQEVTEKIKQSSKGPGLFAPMIKLPEKSADEIVKIHYNLISMEYFYQNKFKKPYLT